MRYLAKNAALFILYVVFILPGYSLYADEYRPNEGDIIFQSLPYSPLVRAIEGATHSPYSHVGVVIRKSQQWWVREAIGDVHDTPLKEFINRGRGQKYDVFRLKEKYRLNIPKFISATRHYLGRPYDIRYRMDEEKIYCSELVFKAYYDVTNTKMGKVVTLGSLDWAEYTPLIKSIEGGDVPVKRKMITPYDLSRAKQLELIYSTY